VYFKKLEIIGFKSFAEKTEIRFEPGVTAIVGPNGCGKSNVADAIRWVLGEQSAKSLRGSSMEDVIFNGSSSREAVNVAEVSLTLNNASKIFAIDYEEVTITRRLYRSGDSEYLLNKNIVRLKDIHELLLGTGIGTENYSIIEQGKMDRILNSKPDERREIFEEAAGITKFKSKKKEALRKLEQTDANLLRVNDIVVEVKRQIGSIERQAKKAESYKREFEKMKSLEIAVAAREFRGFEDRRRGRGDQLNALKEQEIEYRLQLETLEDACRAKREELQRVEESLRARDAEEMAATADVRRNQDRAFLNRERIGELAEKKENLSRQIEDAVRRIEEFKAEHAKLDAEFEAVRVEEEEGALFLSSVEASFTAIEDAVRAAESAEADSRASLSDLGRRRADNQAELAKVEAEFAALTARAQKLEGEGQVVRKEAGRAADERSAAGTRLGEHEGSLRAKADEKAALEARLAALESELRQDEEELNRLSLEQSSLKTKLETLSDLKNRHEGFLGGVKALLEEKENGRAPGMVGLLADLVKADKGYELAAEAALESYLQAVVFGSDAEVLAAADYLRPLNRGRAILLSLESLTAAHLTPALTVSAEPVISFLRPQEHARALVERLVRNIFVVDDPAEAFRIARSVPGAVCVTRGGERFEGEAVMGGSLSSDADLSVVGRESRLEEVRSAIEALDRRILEGKSLLEAKRAESLVMGSSIKALGEEVVGFQVALGDEKSRLRHLEEIEFKLREELLAFETENAQLSAEREAISGRRERCGETASSFDAEENEIAAALALAAETIRTKGDEKDALLVRLAETRSHQSHCTARREKIEKDKNWVLESVTGEGSRRDDLTREASEAAAKREALEAENAALDEEIGRLSERRDEALREAERLRGEREETISGLAIVERERDGRLSFLKGASDKVHAFELEQSEIRHEIDRLKERIFNAYQIDILTQGLQQETLEGAQAAFGGDGVFDVDGAKAEIQAYRDKLAKMGPVNLVAIEEFEEMRQRHDFLTQQQADLLQAKDDLHKAIQKINRTTRELFVETFAQVRTHFTSYYRLLFGGGTADLVLLDENDVLESGIEIVARPPGKKLQQISLLSGGEKALTAVALLFSLFKVRPSPFCVLDEIDAPLDEANVERFCNVLHEFIAGSQFIMITHNKRTMSLADALYGITMAQTGVSRIVSVKFADGACKEAREAQLVHANGNGNTSHTAAAPGAAVVSEN